MWYFLVLVYDYLGLQKPTRPSNVHNSPGAMLPFRYAFCQVNCNLLNVIFASLLAKVELNAQRIARQHAKKSLKKKISIVKQLSSR